MYPFIRLVSTYCTARHRRRLTAAEESRLVFRVLVSDIDFYPELNNGRHLTLMDMGRLDLAIRTGIFDLLRPNRWGLVVAGASVRYRHRLPLFSRFVLSTQIVGRDRLWFYFHQKTIHRGMICSAALVRAGLTSRDGVVPTDDVMDAVGDASVSDGMPDWVAAWSSADELRPWT